MCKSCAPSFPASGGVSQTSLAAARPELPTALALEVEFKKIAATIGPVDWTAIKAKVRRTEIPAWGLRVEPESSARSLAEGSRDRVRASAVLWQRGKVVAVCSRSSQPWAGPGAPQVEMEKEEERREAGLASAGRGSLVSARRSSMFIAEPGRGQFGHSVARFCLRVA